MGRRLALGAGFGEQDEKQNQDPPRGRAVNPIFRRELLDRDPPTDFKAVFAELRQLTGWGTSVIAFALNEPRTTVAEWEKGRDPGYDNGRAIFKLLTKCRALSASNMPIAATALVLETHAENANVGV